MQKRFYLFLLAFCSSLCLKSQSIDSVEVSSLNVNLSQLINAVENQSGYFFSFNSKSVDLQQPINFKKRVLAFSDILEQLRVQAAIESKVNPTTRKIILTTFTGYIINGVVRDKTSKESIPDVYIYDDYFNDTQSNEEGYFRLRMNPNSTYINFSSINYKHKSIGIKGNEIADIIVELEISNILPDVLVTTKNDDKTLIFPHEHDLKEVLNTPGTLGNSDLLGYLRTQPGVSVGNEGQNGFIVRGGTIDQNLILIDGLPIYEANHLGGLSSIFITDAIKDVDFYKSAFPARYGGKLSSVMDVRLKDGDRDTLRQSIRMGLEGVDASIQGPLGNKTSFIINGKTSWFTTLAGPLIQNSLDFNTTDLSYKDLYGKVSHWFSPSNRISITAYNGNDRILLRQNVVDENNLSYDDVNNIKWVTFIKIGSVCLPIVGTSFPIKTKIKRITIGLKIAIHFL